MSDYIPSQEYVMLFMFVEAYVTQTKGIISLNCLTETCDSTLSNEIAYDLEKDCTD